VPVWYVAPLEMNEVTHWGQGYNQPPTGCSAEERPNKRPLTLTLLYIQEKIIPKILCDINAHDIKVKAFFPYFPIQATKYVMVLT
jgi:hypothetical protein